MHVVCHSLDDQNDGVLSCGIDPLEGSQQTRFARSEQIRSPPPRKNVKNVNSMLRDKIKVLRSEFAIPIFKKALLVTGNAYFLAKTTLMRFDAHAFFAQPGRIRLHF